MHFSNIVLYYLEHAYPVKCYFLILSGSSKSALKNEDEVLAQILASDIGGSSSSRSSFPNQSDSSLNRTGSGSDFSHESSFNVPIEMVSSSPEELRQQALDEKKKYRLLKGEGKPEEALKAFKRGKDLERQADALEIYLRKSRKKAALPVGSMSENPNLNLTGDGSKKSRLKSQSRGSSDSGRDDLMSELKELGWSEMDIQNEDKKSGNMSVEGELSVLIGEVSNKTNIMKANRGIDRTEITAHKRKALMLKRDGKLGEAKEELKKAKLLEKQAEEQELLAGAEDSDDEFSDLIRYMDENKQEKFSSDQDHNQLDRFIGVGDIDNVGADLNFEITEEDMQDPDLTAALKSLGWEEESNQTEAFGAISGFSQEDRAPRVYNEPPSSAIQGPSGTMVQKPRRSRAEIQRELLGLKRKALTLRREGNAEEAEEMLKAAKGLENEISELDAIKNKPTRIEPPVKSSLEEADDEEVTENDLQDPSLLVMLKDLGWMDEEQHEAMRMQEQSLRSTGPDQSEITKSLLEGAVRVPKSKAKIQRELLGLKRKALELRRKGEMEEAEEVLRKAKVLEAEMEELEAVPKDHQPMVSEETEAETLKPAAANVIVKDAVEVTAKPVDNVPEKFQYIGSTNKSMEEFSEPSNRTHGNALAVTMDLLTGDDGWRIPPVPDQKQAGEMGSSHPHPLSPSDQNTSAKSSPEKDSSLEKRPQVIEPVQESALQKTLSPLAQEILEHKKRALALKREGRVAEAKEELKQAKLLEKGLDKEKPYPQPSVTISSSSTVPSTREEREPPTSAPKPLSGRERFKIQQESLRHKRQALKLRKEGRIQEAEAEFELAKTLEAQLEESGPNDSGKSSMEGVDDVVVEDLLDPELLSALSAIGIENSSSVSRSSDQPKLEPVRLNAGRNDSGSLNKERAKLEEEIRAEKAKALNLKRSGKQAEALDALRHAKLLEKKLNTLASH